MEAARRNKVVFQAGNRTSRHGNTTMNIATTLTFSRLVIAPFFAYGFIHGVRAGSASWLWGAAIMLALMELSDAFDGYAARNRGEVTDFGKVFDPMADSLARMTCFLSFLLTGIIPLWMFLIFFYRDSFMSLLRIICAAKGTVLAARRSGKLKAIIQAVAIILVLLVCLAYAHGLSWAPRTVAGQHPGFWIMLVPAVITALSIFDYLIPNMHAVKSMMEVKKPGA